MKWLGANPRLAWAVALASVALWVATAPATLGSLLPQFADDASSGELFSVIAEQDTAAVAPTAGPSESVTIESGDDRVVVSGNQVTVTSDQRVTVTSGGAVPEQPPFPTFPPFPSMEPFPTFPPLPTTTPRSPVAPAGEATFTLCGGPDPKAEQDIAQLIGGRNFSARLNSRSDGCADLTITVMPQSIGATTGRQSTNLTVSVGSTGGAPARSVSIQIATENGVTRVSIGAGK